MGTVENISRFCVQKIKLVIFQASYCIVLRYHHCACRLHAWVSIFCFVGGGFAAPQHVQGGATPLPQRAQNLGHPPTFAPFPWQIRASAAGDPPTRALDGGMVLVPRTVGEFSLYVAAPLAFAALTRSSSDPRRNYGRYQMAHGLWGCWVTCKGLGFLRQFGLRPFRLRTSRGSIRTCAGGGCGISGCTCCPRAAGRRR